MKQILFWVGTVVVAAACNGLIYQKEQTLTHGRQVFLKLAPVDPRSLMQGDYMRLGYDLADQLRATKLPPDGRLIVQLDTQGIGTTARLEDDKPLAANETLLRYRYRKGLRLGAESFFFQEGQAQVYDKAKYGELRVEANGDSVLVGLRGENLEVLGKP
jgi:uncharacterized membrane-anchored protein